MRKEITFVLNDKESEDKRKAAEEISEILMLLSPELRREIKNIVIGYALAAEVIKPKTA